MPRLRRAHRQAIAAGVRRYWATVRTLERRGLSRAEAREVYGALAAMATALDRSPRTLAREVPLTVLVPPPARVVIVPVRRRPVVVAPPPEVAPPEAVPPRVLIEREAPPPPPPPPPVLEPIWRPPPGVYPPAFTAHEQAPPGVLEAHAGRRVTVEVLVSLGPWPEMHQRTVRVEVDLPRDPAQAWYAVRQAIRPLVDQAVTESMERWGESLVAVELTGLYAGGT